MKKIKKIAKLFILLFLSAVIGGYFLVQIKTYDAMPEALESMNEENVEVQDKVLIFEPESDPIANLVFYQGGLVEAAAYAPLAQLLAEQGVRVFIPNMFLNLAITNTSKFESIFNNYDDGNAWFIGGHSLGGASASIYVANNPTTVDGIFFLGSYPSNNSDLSNLPLSVVSITATNDAIINIETYQQTKSLLPPDAVYIEIEGGNHSYFGYYGFQKGDGESVITREEQHKMVVNALMGVPPAF
ncbi:MAG: alpha/beta hydrolase [Bacillaceae bacterium]|nr:alpha/beta hydrolase [Bacillaceae bacterium]